MRGSRNFSLGIFYRPFKNSLALIRFPLSFSLVYNFFTHFVISKSLGGLLSVYFFCVEKNLFSKIVSLFSKKKREYVAKYFIFLKKNIRFSLFIDLTYITWNFWVRIGFKGVEKCKCDRKIQILDIRYKIRSSRHLQSKGQV